MKLVAPIVLVSLLALTACQSPLVSHPAEPVTATPTPTATGVPEYATGPKADALKKLTCEDYKRMSDAQQSEVAHTLLPGIAKAFKSSKPLTKTDYQLFAAGIYVSCKEDKIKDDVYDHGPFAAVYVGMIPFSNG